MAATPDVDRAFVRLQEGLVHYRHAGEVNKAAALPLYMVHAGPGSSAGMAPLISELGKTRWVVAPDTLGNGDSVGPGLQNPDVAYYADSVIRIMDKLNIEKADYFGTHTGSHIGVELLLTRPDRVRKAIFDGIGIFPDDLKKKCWPTMRRKSNPMSLVVSSPGRGTLSAINRYTFRTLCVTQHTGLTIPCRLPRPCIGP